jgi:hypothetical protein
LLRLKLKGAGGEGGNQSGVNTGITPTKHS